MGMNRMSRPHSSHALDMVNRCGLNGVLGVLATEERVVDDALPQPVHVGLQIGRKVEVDYVVEVGDGDLEANVLERGHDAARRRRKHLEKETILNSVH